jgi:hypothetical protein
MHEFNFYFGLGWSHIISWDALDHILFILALTAIFHWKDWKKLFVLVTAFTVGHSLTLALSSFNMVRIPSDITEFLIPITILVTGVIHFFRSNPSKGIGWQYTLALGFGLVHGLGFANTIRVMLASSESITLPLLSFNLGLEAGQLLMVSALLTVNHLLVNKLKISQLLFSRVISGIAVAAGVYFSLLRWPF